MLATMFNEDPVPFHWTPQDIKTLYAANLPSQYDNGEEEGDGADSDDDINASASKITSRVGQWYLVKPSYTDAPLANGYRMKYWLGRARLCEKDAEGWPGCRMQYFETKKDDGVHHPQRRSTLIKDLDFVWDESLTMQLPDGSVRQVR